MSPPTQIKDEKQEWPSMMFDKLTELEVAVEQARQINSVMNNLINSQEMLNERDLIDNLDTLTYRQSKDINELNKITDELYKLYRIIKHNKQSA